MRNLKNFLVNKISQTVPLMAVFTLPCQGDEAIGQCISQIYTVSLTLVGIVAFVQIVYGGFMLLTAAGNTSKTGQAMDKIKNAVLGIVLLFSSYLILNTINPDLVKFNFVLPKITKEEGLGNPNQFTRIDNFDVNPKFVTYKTNDALQFTVRVYGTVAGVETICPGENVMKQDVFLKKPANTGTDSTAGINISSRPFNKSLFGDGKVLSFDFSQTIQEVLLKDVAITFNANNSPSAEFYTTLSCGSKELNRSAPVRVNIVWGAAGAESTLTPIFVFSGQSNMTGLADISELPADLRQSQSGVFYYFPNNSWSAYAPAYENWDQFISVYGDAAKKWGVGPEVSAGKLLALAKGTIGMVKYAYPGTNLAVEWNPDTQNSHYSKMISRVRTALGDFQRQRGSTGKVAAFFWMQGESDALDETMANAYQQNLTDLISKVRADLGDSNLPVVIGKISNSPVWTYRNIVRTAQEQVAVSVPNVFIVSTDDLPRYTQFGTQPDNMHYTTSGTVNLGNKFANALR